jgi:iron complex outermembrane receptor protein
MGVPAIVVWRRGHAYQVVAAATTLALLLAGTPATLAQVATEGDASTGQLEEVLVTAARREQPLSKVPISISTFDAADMDARGVKTFQDLIRLTPGLNMLEDQTNGANRVSIRGVASTAGAATTGIYIDDTPIQAIRLGDAGGTAYPGLFDVERVEILRGPQGTLYGAGSEGGTVRFITTPADVRKLTVYARGEAATLDQGSPTYEAGVAFGGPLLPDVLGYRISLYERREGGWIDLVDGRYQIVDPAGNAYGNSVDFTRTATLAQDVNWNRTQSVRVALKYQPADTLTLTPAFFYNKRHLNDGAGNYFDLATSDTGARNYSRQDYRIGAPGSVYTVTAINAAGVVENQPLTLNSMNVPNNASGDDEFRLWSLGINWYIGGTQLVSSSSYFDRTSKQWYDATKDYSQAYLSEYFLAPDRVTSTGTYPPLGWKAMSPYEDAQKNYVEELRLQSRDGSERLTWVAGAFYAHDEQDAQASGSENFLVNSPWVGFEPAAWGDGLYAVNSGPPYFSNCGTPGPCTAAQNFFGDSMLANAVSYLATYHRTDEQFAGFAQADYRLSEKWKLTLGLRVSHNSLDFSAASLGPENNMNAPLGSDCPTAPTPCVYGSGALAPSYASSSAHSSDTATTPRYGLTFQIDSDKMVYATAAKGYRPAGASLRLPSFCNEDLKSIGYVDASGNPDQPLTYQSDSLWSYELGSKNRLLGGRLVLDGSVYLIKWNNIQATVIPNCGVRFVDNLANATSKGFDVGFELKATDRLAFEGAVGYNKATFDQDATSPNGSKVIYNGGSGIPNAGPPWSVSLSGEYTWPLAAGIRGYARADYTYSSEWRRYGVTDPGTPSYDPRRNPTPAYDVVNIRLGTQFKGLDVSLFVKNLTNAAPDLFRYSDKNFDPQDWHDITLRSRSYGLTLTWHR